MRKNGKNSSKNREICLDVELNSHSFNKDILDKYLIITNSNILIIKIGPINLVSRNHLNFGEITKISQI